MTNAKSRAGQPSGTPTDSARFEIICADGPPRTSLEDRRPRAPVTWMLVASGYWYQGRYHGGHIAYYLANTGPGQWVLDSLERNAELDDLTQEDIDDGAINDDQSQALGDRTLEEAQSDEYSRIVAVCSGAPSDWDAKHVAALLYRAVCKSGGAAISEPDSADGLLSM